MLEQETAQAPEPRIRHWRDAKDVAKLIARVEYLESARRRIMNAKEVKLTLTTPQQNCESLGTEEFDARNAALDYVIRQIADLRHAIKLEYGIEAE